MEHGHEDSKLGYFQRVRTPIAVSARVGRVATEPEPSHELRHSSITNAAAAGTSPEALMSRAGHSSYATTRRYIDLAGERFREEADRLEDRLFGESVEKAGRNSVAEGRASGPEPAKLSGGAGI